MKPRKWDDPFENFLLNSVLTTSAGETISLHTIREKYYAQCWTYKTESDAMWRIYSPFKNGVKIKTTLRKYFDSFFDSTNNFASISYFGGNVIYWEGENIKRIFSELSFINFATSSGREMAKTLLIKRTAFSHEEEFRFIFSSPEDPPANLGSGAEWDTEIYSFPIDPSNLIDEFVIDPRLDENGYQVFRERLINSGVEDDRISQSDLYKPPRFSIKEMG